MSILDLFALLGGMAAVLTASIVCFHPNILYAAVALTFTLMSVAGLYAVLGADFIAAVQLLIYVGGIIIVILFAIMMSENIYRNRFLENARKYLAPALFGVAIFMVLLKLIGKANIELITNPERIPVSAPIGRALISLYMVPLEYTALLLLVGLVGAVVIARPNYKEVIRHED